MIEEQQYDVAGAARYQAHHRKNLRTRLSTWRERRLVARALARSGIAGRILDAPCGTGRFWPELARYPATLRLALDNSDAMLQAARLAPDAPALALLAGSLFDLPLPERSIDCVLCLRFMHHIAHAEDRMRALAEIRRVSRRYAIVSPWVDGNLAARRRRRRDAVRERPRGFGPRLCRPAVEAEREFAAAGFTLVRHFDLLPRIAMWRVYLLEVTGAAHLDYARVRERPLARVQAVNERGAGRSEVGLASGWPELETPGGFYVKRQQRYYCRPLWNGLRLTPTLRRELRAIELYGRLGIGVPQVLGYGEDGRGGAVLVLAVVPGRDLEAAMLLAPERRPAIVTRVAETLQQLHAHRLRHGAVYPAHVLVNGSRVRLIDLEKTRRVGSRVLAAAGDLARLFRHAPFLAPAEREAMLRVYPRHRYPLLGWLIRWKMAKRARQSGVAAAPVRTMGGSDRGES